MTDDKRTELLDMCDRFFVSIRYDPQDHSFSLYEMIGVFECEDQAINAIRSRFEDEE